MFNLRVKELLKSNWGEKAETLNCYAEVKLIDPLSSWCCYIFAMNPDEDMVHCLLYSKAFGCEIHILYTYNIQLMYNEEGESPIIDHEFRRTRVSELIKRLGCSNSTEN